MIGPMRSRGDGVSTPLLVAVLVAIAVSFTLSSAAGMGGSLVLIPVLIAVVGVKEGIALSALLLAANNVAKVIAYRTTLPFFRTQRCAATGDRAGIFRKLDLSRGCRRARHPDRYRQDQECETDCTNCDAF